jgi:hypothetical protein
MTVMGLNCPSCKGLIKVVVQVTGELETVEACAPLFGLVCTKCGALLVIEDRATIRLMTDEEWQALDPFGQEELTFMKREARYNQGNFLWEN